ncbi:MAG: prephenate dehydratase domain-containing protein [Eubacteriales bacterium]|jgi:chorismate mutase/prephenate dehydratase|nr:prephenate dehydratase domain-containing protein [Eubacteriales bacterium]MDD4104689.1 prephenate dehydratase domain-containing protein [Eubacteriales bacterium]MDD4710977.1 prephenate dehydratase domain-containing protein [Eubacteriales bacterium]NLO16334.1 bifunctional chorismate mutase/prephenate dehydratase [Clostridiales bacterium]
MSLNELREKIDGIDQEMVRLFHERMQVSGDIASYKVQHCLPIYDPAREREKLQAVGEISAPDMRSYTQRLYACLFELSRARQRGENSEEKELMAQIRTALDSTPPLFPERAAVAVQGVEGAYAQKACEKLFKLPGIVHVSSFEGVFRAIDSGLSKYGVLPLENSTAGSVNRIYDLMMQYNFHIVRSTRLKIDHCLLGRKGTKMGDIREIISHEQALSQCEGFIKSLGNVKVTPCRNTAAAAKTVFESGRNDIAALSSANCAELYDLDILGHSVQDSGSNFTRFICIAKELEIYPGADTTSMMMVLPHRPGSLYGALGRFWASGINLNKLESRPLPESDFEFMFYFDLQTSVYSEEFPLLFRDLKGMCSQFRYLGSYLEVV